MTAPATIEAIPDDVIDAALAALRPLGGPRDVELTPAEMAVIVAVYRAAVVGDELDDHEARLRAIPALSALQRRSVDVVLANLTRLRRVEVAILREVEQAQVSEHGMVHADVLQQVIARGGT